MFQHEATAPSHAQRRILRVHRVVTGISIFLVAFTCFDCAPDEAAREYRAAFRAEDEDASAAEVLAHLDRAVALAPDRLEYRHSRAIARIDSRQFNRALEDIDATLAATDHAYTFYLRGLVLCELGRFEESLPAFDAAIDLQPENAQFYRGRSLARTELGLLDAALEDADEHIRRAPEMAIAYYARGHVLTAMGRTTEAITALQQARRMRNELHFVHLALANALEEGGRIDRARAIRDSLNARPGTPIWAYADPFRY